MSEETEGSLYTSSVVEDDEEDDPNSQSGSEGETDHENVLQASDEEQFPYSSLDSVIVLSY
jgi:hypothetical protein